MSETAENRLKRLRIRSWRRGIKENDLILGNFADSCLGNLNKDQLDAYEKLIEMDDHPLYAMFGTQTDDAPDLKNILNTIRKFHNLAET